MKGVFCILVVVSSLACIRAAPTTNTPSLADKLDQFATLVESGFRSIALTLRELRSGQAIDHNTVAKLIKLQGKLQTSHASLSKIVDGLSKSLPKFDKLSKAVSDLQGLVLKCPTSWKQFDGFCYKFTTFTSSTSADTALAACKSLGATLTRVRSAKHQTFLQSSLSGKYLFVGGNDRDTEGTWIWPDGVLIKDGGYTNWASGEPDSEDCMYVDTNGKWYDLSCTSNLGSSWGYVCEKLLR